MMQRKHKIKRDSKLKIQEEAIKAIQKRYQREQTQLIVSAQRRIEDLSLTDKDAKRMLN
jgi:hypothetical protein